jgi:hypothetical protein
MHTWSNAEAGKSSGQVMGDSCAQTCKSWLQEVQVLLQCNASNWGNGADMSPGHVCVEDFLLHMLASRGGGGKR